MSEVLQRELVEVSHYCHKRGWALATSGKFSARSGADRIWINSSGQDKGALITSALVEVTLEGVPLGSLIPSAETKLHCELYRRNSAIGVVLHTHSPHSTVLSREYAGRGFLEFRGYEMLKAFEGVRTHEHSEVVPIFPNQQDMDALANLLLPYLKSHENCHAFLIENHGLYTWGKDIRQAVRHLEALEFLMECEYLASTRRHP